MKHTISDNPIVMDYEFFNTWVNTEHFDYNNFDHNGNFICKQTTKPNVIIGIFENW